MHNQIYVIVLIIFFVILITIYSWNRRHYENYKNPGKNDCTSGYELGCMHHCLKSGGNLDECEWNCSVGDICRDLVKYGISNPCSKVCYPSI